MQCSSSGGDIRLLVDIRTETGIQQVCALFDSGATISLIQPFLHPKIVGVAGMMELRGYQVNSPAEKAQIVRVMVSLDGQTWQTMDAVITHNVADQMILSPQGISGYKFELQGTSVEAFYD